MGYGETTSLLEQNSGVNQPRLRVNKTTAFTLTTSWQTITWDGTSPFNLNSFPTIPGQTNPSVWYDSTTSTIRFTANGDRNYNIALSASVGTNPAGLISAVTSLLGLSSYSFAQLRMRFMIPAPTPIYFPLPDFGGYLDIGPVNLVAQTNLQQVVPVFANQVVRDNGLRVQVCLSGPTLGTATFNGGDLNLFRG